VVSPILYRYIYLIDLDGGIDTVVEEEARGAEEAGEGIGRGPGV
jgi:hypothetical protein